MSINQTLKALADPIQSEILNLQKNGRLSAGENTEHFSVTAESISRPLSVLKEADLIREKREEKYIIFDMDGVLMNTEPLHYKLWRQVFREKGLEIDYEHYKGCIGSTNHTLFNLIEEGYGVRFHEDKSVLVRFKELKNQYIHENGIPPIDGVNEGIEKLKEMGYHLAVASSSPQEYIEICTEKIGIKQYFDILCSAERVERPKPFPDVFLNVAEWLGAKPEECIVVEDSYNGSKAAKAAGMACLGFANPDSGEQDLSMDDVVFYPFAELIDAVKQIK